MCIPNFGVLYDDAFFSLVVLLTQPIFRKELTPMSMYSIFLMLTDIFFSEPEMANIKSTD